MPTQRNRKKRPIIFLSQSPSIALVELTRDQFSIIDVADAVEIGKYNWNAHWATSTRSYYATTGIRNDAGRWVMVGMHQFLLGMKEGHTSDHINRNTLDNRRSNLRHADRNIQNTNQRIRKDNTSGHKGIQRVRSKWRVLKQENGVQVHVGYFGSLEEAILARGA